MSSLWLFIILYGYIAITTFAVVASDRFIADRPAPLITAFLSAFLWPLFALWYIGVGIRKFYRQILKELSELGNE
jgi:hypothetical protein